MTANLEHALRQLYFEHNANISITSFHDDGWIVRLGDELNGFKAERAFRRTEFQEIGQWILETAAGIRDWGPIMQPEPETVEAFRRSLWTLPYRQRWPNRITMEDWLALAHPHVPLLPWIADNGAEVCSFALDPFDVGAGTLLFDAHGINVVLTAEPRIQVAILETAIVLGGKVDRLTFLPAAVRV